jgi:alpha-tubulin suppressor-like RCC1 family protein
LRTRLLALVALLGLAFSVAALPANAQDGPVAGAPMPAPPTPPTESGPVAPAEATVTGIRSMATGYYQSCAVLNNGQARCSGYNEYGQLGDGTTDDHTRAVSVRNRFDTGPLTGVVQMAAGDYHTCALLTNQEVRCWGYNSAGQLGDGTTDDHHLPTPVKNVGGVGRLDNVVQITASDEQTCAVLTSGQARCWGDNAAGEVGDGSDGNDRYAPRRVLSVSGPGYLTQVSQIDSGDDHTCARLTNGQARCWGYGYYGELGNDDDADHARPVVVRAATGTGPLSGVRQISAGGYHSCAVLNNNQARCWGYNYYGNLGDGTDDDRDRPVVVKNTSGSGPLLGVSNVVAGAYHSCALLTNDQVRCWGENDYDEVGNGIESGPNVPLPVAVRNRLDTGNLVGVRSLVATSYNSCVTLNNGQGRCWGYDSYGSFGNGTTDQQPLPVIFSS